MAKITFKTDLDNSDLEKELKKAKAEIERESKSVEKNKAAKLPLTQEMNELSGAVDEAAHKLAKLEAQKKSIAATLKNGGADPEAYAKAYAEKGQVEKDYLAQEKEVDKLQKKWEAVAKKVDGYDAKIKASTESININQAKAGKLQAKLSSGGHKLGEAMSHASKSAKSFEHRIISLGKRVFIFSLITMALRAMRQYMGKLLQTNAQYQAELAKLKGALMTAFQPIYEFILPGLLAVLRIITAVVQVVANVLSALTGKTAKQSADAAKALNKESKALGGVGAAAKEAEKSLASFDEINKLSEPETGSGMGGGGLGEGMKPNFDAWNNDEYKKKIDELTAYLSGALLAVGAILAFSGINIPLGIALMAAGAIGLVALAKENWGAMDEDLKRAITNVLLIVGGAFLVIGAVLAFSGIAIAQGITLMAMGAAALAGAAALNWDALKDALKGPIGGITALISGALLVLGAILAFSGVALPLGIALMVVGAAGLATVTALNWDTIVTALRGPIGGITALVSGALLVIGIILCCTGVALPLGIALIAAGAIGLVAVTALNWNKIVDMVKGVWNNITAFWNAHIAPVFTKAWWQNKMNVIGEGLKSAIKSGINSGIAMINRFTAWLSGILSFSIPPINIGDKQIFSGFTSSVSIPQIPYLAKGAVLPANNPFLAVVGDQSRGTNVEAPLETIKQAVAEVMGPEQMLDMLANIVSLLAQIRDGNGEIDMRRLAQLITKQQRNIQRAGG